jgi:molecular chaperone GrpE
MNESTRKNTDGEDRDQDRDRDRDPSAAEGRAEGVVASHEPSTAELKAEVVRYKAEAEQNWQQFLHAAADLENYKKQAQRAREDAVRQTRRAMLTAMLTVVDNLDRALEYGAQAGGIPEAERILEGLKMTQRRILELLANLGVKPFESVGHRFDPRFHEAVEVVPASPEHPAGVVVAEVQRGYLMGDEVLRPSRVRVAREA